MSDPTAEAEELIGMVCTHLLAGESEDFRVAEEGALAVGLCADCMARCQGDWTQFPDDHFEVLEAAEWWRLRGLLDAEVDEMVGGDLQALALQEMRVRSDALAEELADHLLPRWRWQADGTLALIDGLDQVAWELSVEHLGSWSERGESWLWAWANPTVPALARARAARVRGLGERLGLAFLGQPELPNLPQNSAWMVSCIAGVLLGAQGLRRLPLPGGLHLFLAVHDWWRPEGWIEDDG